MLIVSSHQLPGLLALVNYESLGRDALLSIPTPDHYLPLLYVLGTVNRRRAPYCLNREA